MTFYADLHVHSKYSRATSKDCDLEHLAYWAARKGIEVLGTGDFTHPAWRDELRSKLVPAEPGLFRLRDDIQHAVDRRLPPACRRAVRFLLSVEISTIKKRGERTRKVHHLVYAPDLASVDAMVARIARVAQPNALPGDGRPILGLDPRDLLEIVLESGPWCYLVPAHAWTPHFAVLGSRSGFDRVTDCYLDLADHIFALETGLSSDPEMNWRVSHLDRYTLVSNSDAHSPGKLGREASSFSCERDYFAMREALVTRRGFAGTVEFFPEEGKYHLDGHRKCGVVLEPAETRAHDGRCPVCREPLTIGVMHRVQELADRPAGFRPDDASPFRSLVPLPEVIAELAGTGVASKAVARDYDFILTQLGAELDILERTPVEDIAHKTSSRLAEAVTRMRAGQVIRKPGFDGEYGVIRLFEDGELGGSAVAMTGPGRPAESDARAELAILEQPGEPLAGSGSVEDSPGTPSPGPGREISPVTTTGASEPAPGDGGGSGSSSGASDGSEHLAVLDLDQRSAAVCTDGPLLIVAGPGTGKTHTLARRIAHLVTHRGAAPAACLAITFTNRAARELAERLHTILPDHAASIPVMTFHRLALGILQENRQDCGLARGFRIAGDRERAGILAKAMSISERRARRLVRAMSTVKRTGAPVEPDSDLARAMAVQKSALEQAGLPVSLLDFDDLLLLAVAFLDSHADARAAYRARYRWLAIDEYQDIDALQYRLVQFLCPPGGNICAIGDPDQAIYGFRGGDVAFFTAFTRDFPGARTVHLGRNYRSTRIIVDAALQAVAPSSLVPGRTLVTRRDGCPIELVTAASARAEAEFVVHTIERLVGGLSFFALDSGRVGHGDSHTGDHDFSDFAVLYRTEAQTSPLVEALARASIPFQKRSHQKLSDHPAVAALARTMVALDASDRTALDASDRTALDASDRTALDASDRRSDVGLVERLRAAAALLRSGGLGGDGDSASLLTADAIAAAVEVVLPLCQRAGDDLEQFLAELACDVEVDTWDPRADRVSLLTLHAAKGLEFRVVFLIGCEDGLLPLRFGADPRPSSPAVRSSTPSRMSSERPLAEERRLFFVGMTRARERLYLTRATRRTWRGMVRELGPSPFLAAIDPAFLATRNARGDGRKKTGRLEQLALFRLDS